MRTTLLLGGLWSLPFLLFSQTIDSLSVLFPTDRSELQARAERQLSNFAERLDESEAWRLEVSGHADERGGEDYNYQLAEARVRAVVAFLEKEGIDPARLSTYVYGEDRPLVRGAGETAWRKNRRVDIRLLPPRYEGLNEVLSGLTENGVQTFSLDGAGPQRIVGAKGTVLWLDAADLTFADGRPVSGPVEIQLREAYALDEMLQLGLHTRAGDKLLETGGMLYLQATSEGEPLQLQTGAEIPIAMPKSDLPGMELFVGNGGNAENGPTDWIAAGAPFRDQVADFMKENPYPEFEKKPFVITRYDRDESTKPQPPSPPPAIYRPHEPRRESVHIHYPFFKRLFMSKAEKEAEKEAIFQERLAEYRRKMETYRQDSIARIPLLKQHRRDFEHYEESLASWHGYHDRKEREWLDTQYAAREKIERKQWEIYQRAVKKWRDKRQAVVDSLVERFDMEGLTFNDANYYFNTLNRFGWINCDRFLNAPASQRIPLLVNSGNAAETRVIALLDGSRSLIPLNRSQGEVFASFDLPRGLEVTLLGIKVENGQLKVALKSTRVGEEEVNLDFEPGSLAQLQALMAELEARGKA